MTEAFSALQADNHQEQQGNGSRTHGKPDECGERNLHNAYRHNRCSRYSLWSLGARGISAQLSTCDVCGELAVGATFPQFSGSAACFAPTLRVLVLLEATIAPLEERFQVTTPAGKSIRMERTGTEGAQRLPCVVLWLPAWQSGVVADPNWTGRELPESFFHDEAESLSRRCPFFPVCQRLVDVGWL